jgi:CBS domain-containing protein
MQHLSGKDVYDVVVRLPKTLSPDTTVDQARAAFHDDHVHMLLITNDQGLLLGTLVRDDLAEPHKGAAPALEHAVLQDRTISPDTSASDALRLMQARAERRRAVIDPDGHLLGLLCLKRRRDGFCSDADVLSRTSTTQQS